MITWALILIIVYNVNICKHEIRNLYIHYFSLKIFVLLFAFFEWFLFGSFICSSFSDLINSELIKSINAFVVHKAHDKRTYHRCDNWMEKVGVESIFLANSSNLVGENERMILTVTYQKLSGWTLERQKNS